MSFDVSKHVLVPKHKKMSETEKSKFLVQLHLQGKELPKISKNDPALNGLDVKPGDLIKVERASKTAGVTNYYRMVS